MISEKHFLKSMECRGYSAYVVMGSHLFVDIIMVLYRVRAIYVAIMEILH